MNKRNGLCVLIVCMVAVTAYSQGIYKERTYEENTSAEYLQEIKDRGNIAIYSFFPSINSADGVSVYFYLANSSQKTIKYFYIDVAPADAFNEVLSCNISGKSLVTLKLTGPIKSGETNFYQSDIAWYNRDIEGVYILKIRVVYTDNSEEIYDTADAIYDNVMRAYDMLRSEA